METMTRPTIKRLSDITINRIAAGEVVERPASVIKELLENSLDAGSTEIVVKIEAGGRNLISVSDNGCGMTRDDMSIAVDKHTTSKLNGNDLLDIRYFGFRGEALPSISAVSRMTIRSLCKGESDAWKLEINGGDKKEAEPTQCAPGTIIEIRDLFFATPARLKFLRTETTEVKHIQEIIRRIAFAHYNVSISLFVDNKESLSFQASNEINDRVHSILGKSFQDNSIPININSEGIKVTGFVSLPTYDRGTSNEQYLYINSRPVKDKLLLSAIRIAYKDFISRDRYPVVVLFIDMPSSLVDVNVHPAKTEVRFRDFNMMRSLLINGLKNALQSGGQRASSTIAEIALGAMNTNHEARSNAHYQPSFRHEYSSNTPKQSYTDPTRRSEGIKQEFINDFNHTPIVKGFEEQEAKVDQHQNHPLGAARCQLHECYIVSQTEDSIVIIDQHAAHERLTYEKLKNALDNQLIDSQRLLIPEVIESDEDVVEKLLAIRGQLSDCGLVIEPCTKKSIIVTSVPFIMEGCDVKKVMQDLLDDIVEFDDSVTLQEQIKEKLSTYACHHSIRSGRKMNIDEMNTLLREMEQVDHSGQCNHGRPTYVKLKLKDIEKLFGRS